jgi:hypothetical protein
LPSARSRLLGGGYKTQLTSRQLRPTYDMILARRHAGSIPARHADGLSPEISNRADRSLANSPKHPTPSCQDDNRVAADAQQKRRHKCRLMSASPEARAA